MKIVPAATKPTQLILLLYLAPIVLAAAKAQLQPTDFDVPDGKLEKLRETA
jgi:hypothetical protein